jgi:predicted RNA-binding Zn-ribbon protein involved in translation (DUF1610 family)
MTSKNHATVPKDTRAYICAECGVVALAAEHICNVQGTGTKADWCGVKGVMPPKHCQNRTNVDRHQCRNCGQTAISAELLCEPLKLEIPGS